MKRRIAYIGLSYPLLYDYKNQAEMTENDVTDSPNPIIESPLGLMILYDELWFLCESICPNNMRKLPYVKFVDQLFPDLYYGDPYTLMISSDYDIDYNGSLSYQTIIDRMKLGNWESLDTHTHGFRLGQNIISASSNSNMFIFDIYVFKALQERCTDAIELVSNSLYRLKECDNSNREAEAAERIIIPNIPNYLSSEGPYHECMEDIRENKYLKDFRKWIIENHSHLQKKEITEICTEVERGITETKNTVLKKYLEENSRFTFFKSTGKAIVTTALGAVCLPISILDAMAGVTSKGKKTCEVSNYRWQGFVVEARDIIESNIYRP